MKLCCQWPSIGLPEMGAHLLCLFAVFLASRHPFGKQLLLGPGAHWQRCTGGGDGGTVRRDCQDLPAYFMVGVRGVLQSNSWANHGCWALCCGSGCRVLGPLQVAPKSKLGLFEQDKQVCAHALLLPELVQHREQSQRGAASTLARQQQQHRPA